MRAPPLKIAAYTTTNALGRGRTAAVTALREMRSGLIPCDFSGIALDTWIGRVAGLEDAPLDGEWAAYDCRNHRLAALALDQDGFRERVDEARDRWGPTRVAVVVGTSTSGLEHTEQCYRRHFAQSASGLGPNLRYATTLTNFALAAFCRRSLGLAGPATTISTACSSGAKAIASARRLILSGLCDAAVAGGVDSLCATTLLGFKSLELLSSRCTSPWGIDRCGISIGEGAGFLLLELDPSDQGALALLGCGETSDAYHISAPHPEGDGAMLAMTAALAAAGRAPDVIDYINLHGTGTAANDRSEDRAVIRVFGDRVAASSTKGATGHALGASGAIEAALCLACIEAGLVPGNVGTATPDPGLSLPVVLETRAAEPRRVLSNSFGFGGSNCALILGRP